MTSICTDGGCNAHYIVLDKSRSAALSKVFTVGGHLPDLTDPATLGCLLHLVREAHDEPEAHARCGWWYGSLTWRVVEGESGTDEHGITTGHDTEAEALVAALEAAP